MSQVLMILSSSCWHAPQVTCLSLPRTHVPSLSQGSENRFFIQHKSLFLYLPMYSGDTLSCAGPSSGPGGHSVSVSVSEAGWWRLCLMEPHEVTEVEDWDDARPPLSPGLAEVAITGELEDLVTPAPLRPWRLWWARVSSSLSMLTWPSQWRYLWPEAGWLVLLWPPLTCPWLNSFWLKTPLFSLCLSAARRMASNLVSLLMMRTREMMMIRKMATPIAIEMVATGMPLLTSLSSHLSPVYPRWHLHIGCRSPLDTVTTEQWPELRQ